MPITVSQAIQRLDCLFERFGDVDLKDVEDFEEVLNDDGDCECVRIVKEEEEK